MMDATRRDFIKRSALLAASAALGGASARSAQAQAALPDGLSWHKAPCRFCGTGCGVMVGVLDGRVVAVQGDPENPVNKGLLCAKGYHAGGILYGKDRLEHPMIRRNGKLERASWNDAIDLVADKIMADPSRFAIYGSGQWTIAEGYVCLKFLKGGLSNNHLEPNARLCMASAVVGLITTFGVDEPAGCYEDLDECDTVITWGNNWAEMHPVLFSRFMDRKKGESKFSAHKSTYIDMATRTPDPPSSRTTISNSSRKPTSPLPTASASSLSSAEPMTASLSRSTSRSNPMTARISGLTNSPPSWPTTPPKRSRSFPVCRSISSRCSPTFSETRGARSCRCGAWA